MSDWIDILLANADLRTLTKTQYALALRYWDAWHRLGYGAPLPLSENPPRALDLGVVRAFIDEHSYVSASGKLCLTMPTERFAALKESGFNIHCDVPTPRTTDFRLTALSTAYKHARLSQEEWHRDWSQRRLHRLTIRQWINDLYANWEAERVTVQSSEPFPMAMTQIMSSLTRVCGSDRDGIRDAALLILLQRITPQQAAALRFKDITLGYIPHGEELVSVIEFWIQQPVSAMQLADRTVRFLHQDAAFIMSWHAIRKSEVADDAPFLVRSRKLHGLITTELSHGWICRRVLMLARRAGLADATGYTTVCPRWIRKGYEREFRERSTLVQVANAAGVTIRGAFRLARGAIKADRDARSRV